MRRLSARSKKSKVTPSENDSSANEDSSNKMENASSRSAKKSVKSPENGSEGKELGDSEKVVEQPVKTQEVVEEDVAATAEEEEPPPEEFEVESIVEMKVIQGKKKFRVRWKGYSEAEDTWEFEKDLNCPELVKKFVDEKKNSRKKRTADSKNFEQEEDYNGTEGSSEKLEATSTSVPSNKKPKRELFKSDDSKPIPKTKGKQGKLSTKKMDADDENQNEGDSSKKGAEVTGESYEVGKIMEVHYKKDGKREFLIHWKGYPHSEDTWEPEEHLDCAELIEKFTAKLEKTRSLNVRELRTSPSRTDRYAEKHPGTRQSRRNKGKERTTYHDAE